MTVFEYVLSAWVRHTLLHDQAVSIAVTTAAAVATVVALAVRRARKERTR